MNTIDEFTIVSTISDISNLLYSYNDDLEELKEKASDIIEKANALDSYNGLKVSGSDRIEYSLESTKFYYDKLTIIGTAEVISNSNYILKEIDRLQTNITSFRNVNLNEFDEAITKVAIYIANLETALALGVISSNKTYDKMNTSDKLYYAGQLISKDKELKYIYLDSTPVIKRGTTTVSCYDVVNDIDCKYLEFYNSGGEKVIAPLYKITYDSNSNSYSYLEMTDEEKDTFIQKTSKFHHEIMLENNKYSDKFKETAIDPLKQITLEYICYDKEKVNGVNWIAATKGSSYCDFDMNYYSKNDATSSFLVESYSHELGHSFDNSIMNGNGKLSSSDIFTNIYNQANINDSKYKLVREYGHTSASEFFAESTLLYYNDPKALMELPLSGVGFDNLYEFMQSVLE